MTMSIDGLRLLQAVATRGSLSAAAFDLGYTQSAASRQLATLERGAGRRLVDRGPRGATLTEAGSALLPHAVTVLQALDDAERAARGEVTRPPLRLGVFPSAGAALLPQTLLALAEEDPSVRVRTTEGTSPALLRALRGGRLDAVVVVSRPPFGPFTGREEGLREDTVGTTELRVAAARAHPFARHRGATLAELGESVWVGPVRSDGDPVLGVWPSLPGHPDVRYRSGDWLAKLRLVAAGLAVTTLPPILGPALPRDVVLVPVIDAPREERRLTLIGGATLTQQAPQLLSTLRTAFSELVTEA